MPLYFAFPASVKLGTVHVADVPELLELLDELLLEELLEELDVELLELEEELLELDDDELDELDEELEELELDAGGSPTQATNVDERTSGAAQRPQEVNVIFMFDHQMYLI